MLVNSLVNSFCFLSLAFSAYSSSICLVKGLELSTNSELSLQENSKLFLIFCPAHDYCIVLKGEATYSVPFLFFTSKIYCVKSLFMRSSTSILIFKFGSLLILRLISRLDLTGEVEAL